MNNSAKFTGMFFIYLIAFILAMVSVTCYKAYATDIPCGSTYKSKYKGETIRCVMPAPKPTPVATPIPTPLPTPVPTPPSGVVCSKTVSTAGNVQSAINGSVAGQTVCLEPAVYNFTSALLMKAQVYLHCKPGAKLVFNGTSQVGVRFNTGADRATISGCEITNAWDGVKDSGKYNTVKNNYIHHNKYQGYLCAACTNATIEGNRIENQGTECNQVAWGGYSPRHCHNIYISNPSGYCTAMSGFKIINNQLGANGGFGVSINGYFCPGYYIDGSIVEGNTFTDTSAGIGLYYQTRNTSIKNNSTNILNPPSSDMSVSMKCGMVAWGEQINESGNVFNLRSDYKKTCQY